MKKILDILPWMPWPLKSGGSQAVFNALKACQQDVKYYLLFPCYLGAENLAKNIEGLKKALPEVELLPYKYEDRQNFFMHVANVLYRVFGNKEKMQLEKNRHNMVFNPFGFPVDFYDSIPQIIAEKQIDIVQCEFLPPLELIYELKKIRCVKTVYVHHEIRFIRNEQYLHSIGKEDSFYYNMFADSLKQREIAALNEYDNVTTLSQMDAQLLKTEGVTTRITASFSIVDNVYKKTEVASQLRSLSFIGGESHQPNFEGITWFLNEVWPKALEKDPSLQLQIIGSWKDNTKQAFEGKYSNVKFLGFVDDLSEALSGTALIVPLNIGSGIRMKIIEAAFMGIPVISTTIGAGGLPFENNQDILIRDDAEGLVDAIFSLKNYKERFRLSEAIYNKANECLSLESLRKNRLSIYNSL